MTRVSSNGTFAAGWGWTAARSRRSGPVHQHGPLAADGAGGLYVAYEAQESDNNYTGIMGTRIRSNGVQPPAGTPRATALELLLSHVPRAVTDGWALSW
jgi:hypothetical protein